MRLKTCYLVLKTRRPVEESSSRLRGFIGRKFSDFTILHDHLMDGYNYSYPKVQYKVLSGTASLLGIEEGAKVIKEISDDIKSIVLWNGTYDITQRILYEQDVELKSTNYPLHYKFVSPWIALNPDNYSKFIGLNHKKDKNEMLNKIMIGNILSMCKGFGINVDKELCADTYLDMDDTETVIYKATPMIGFIGRFYINFEIPQFFGIGKGVSQGFGTVMTANREK